MAKMKAYDSFDLYLADQPPPNQAIIQALRGFVGKAAPKLEESGDRGDAGELLGAAVALEGQHVEHPEGSREASHEEDRAQVEALARRERTTERLTASADWVPHRVAGPGRV